MGITDRNRLKFQLLMDDAMKRTRIDTIEHLGESVDLKNEFKFEKIDPAN